MSAAVLERARTEVRRQEKDVEMWGKSEPEREREESSLVFSLPLS